MGAIGFNNAFQAANRGEHFAAFCVNNSHLRHDRRADGADDAARAEDHHHTVRAGRGQHRLSRSTCARCSPSWRRRSTSSASPSRTPSASCRPRRRSERRWRSRGMARDTRSSSSSPPAPPTGGWTPSSPPSSSPTRWRRCSRWAASGTAARSRASSGSPIEQKTLRDLMGTPPGMAWIRIPDPKFGEKRFKFSGFGGQGVLSLGLVDRRGGRRGRPLRLLAPQLRAGAAGRFRLSARW